jgi:hypothetical protein
MNWKNTLIINTRFDLKFKFNVGANFTNLFAHVTETVNNNLENESKELLISEEDDQTTAIDITDTTTTTTTIQSPQQWKEER